MRQGEASYQTIDTYADRFAKRGYDLLLVARDLDRMIQLDAARYEAPVA